LFKTGIHFTQDPAEAITIRYTDRKRRSQLATGKFHTNFLSPRLSIGGPSSEPVIRRTGAELRGGNPDLPLRRGRR